MNDDLKPFWRAIDAAPGDLLPIGIFADWLEERGHKYAGAMRWAYSRAKVPHRDEQRKWGHSFRWVWVFGISQPYGLPEQLGHTARKRPGRCAYYKTISMAYIHGICRPWRWAGKYITEAVCVPST